MTDNTAGTGPQTPAEPPRNSPRFRGSLIVVAGVVFAFLPLLITLVGSIFVDDAFNEGTSSLGTLPWLTILTMPIGVVVAVIGLVVGVVNLTRRT